MKISRSAILPHNAKNMYDVVADVRSYPGFLAWCNGITIVSESADEVVAELVIAYGKLDFSFTTRNNMQKNQTIQMSLVAGPFSDLTGEWVFSELNDEACKVSLEMDFMFDNPIAHKVFSGVFQKIISTQLDAFQRRANVLYGEPSIQK